MIEMIPEIIVYATAFVGGTNLILRGAKKITGLTPTDKDDKIVSEGQKYVKKAMRVLDKIGGG